MEELAQNLLFVSEQFAQNQPIPSDFEIQASNNIEVGPLILGILSLENFQSLQTNQAFVIISTGLLKTWIAINWPLINIETKQLFFETLHNLIFKPNPQFIQYYANIFCIIASKEIEHRGLYEEYIYEVLNNLGNPSSLPSNVVLSYLQILYCIILKYKSEMNFETLEFSYLESRFATNMTYFFINPEYVAQQEGETIMILAFKSLFCLYHRKPFPETMDNAINLAFTIIRGYVENTVQLSPRLIGYCFKFLYLVFDLPTMAEAEELKQTFFETSLHALEYALENNRESDYLINKILIAIASLPQYLSEDENMLSLFISAAQPSESDIREAQFNPSVYIDRAYTQESKDSNVPMMQAIGLISHMAKRSASIAQILLSLESNETSSRVLAICASSLVKHGLAAELIQWVSNAASNAESDDLSMASVLFLMSKTVSFVDDDAKNEFLNICLPLIDKDRVIVAVCACELLTKLVQNNVIPPQEIFPPLFFLSKKLVSPHASNCLRAIAKRCPSVIGENAVEIYEEILALVEEEISQFESVDDGFDEDNFGQHLTMLESIITVAGKHVIGERLQNLVAHFLTLEDGEFFGELSKIICAIVKADPQFSLQILSILLQSFVSNECACGFISQLSKPLLLYISMYPHEFMSSKITQMIIEVCMQILASGEESEYIGEILAWAFVADKEVDCSGMLALAQATLEEEGSPEEKLMATFVIASLFISRDIPIVADHAALFLQWSNDVKRNSDRQLCILALLKACSIQGVADECFFNAARVFANVKAKQAKANEEEDEEEEFEPSDDDDDEEMDFFEDDEMSYDFKSPFELISIAEYRNEAVGFCSQDCINAVTQKFPIFMQ